MTASAGAPCIFLVAADTSADAHTAEFVRALRRSWPRARFLGMGGSEMEKAGVELVVHQHELAVAGFVEVLSSLGRIGSAWRRLGRALASDRADLIVLVDAPDFNLPFARRARRLSAAPIFYYIAPQVWAWRRGRVRKLARRVDRLAVIFPFEREVFAGMGAPVDFVGHPLVDRTRSFLERVGRDSARRALGLGRDAPLVTLLPGSRRNELAHQLPLQLEVARRLFARESRMQFSVALAPSLAREAAREIIRAARLPTGMEVGVVEGLTYEAILAAELVLAKPGTSTLETALLGRPLVVLGRGHPLSAAIARRLVRVEHWAMPNLIAGERVVPEFLQEEADPDRVAAAAWELLEGPARDEQLAALARVRGLLGDGGASERAAAIARETLGHPAA